LQNVAWCKTIYSNFSVLPDKNLTENVFAKNTRFSRERNPAPLFTRKKRAAK